jgi:UDP-N-acetylmuramoyl-L-alanyl-D-glutamate--2,6-diaminopimelate ligase
VAIQRLLREMVDRGCTHCFMEVSSHAIDQKRIAGLHFTGGIFTNISHDHLDYHKTFEAYIRAKQRFFTDLGSDAFALVNADDRNAKIMVQASPARKRTYGLRSMCDTSGKIVENSFAGLMMNIDGLEVSCRLTGTFNAYNLLAVYATARLLGIEKQDALRELSKLQTVPGRFEHLVSDNHITGIVDYAHTPDALLNVLHTVKDIRTGNEQVITVVGCGGDRDTGKRPVMARIASELSDKVILTSDNPRSEDPMEIIRQMQTGVPAQHYKKILSVADRREAIRTACSIAKPGDIILVAGKGHEKYQEVKGHKLPFDDMQVLAACFDEIINSE